MNQPKSEVKTASEILLNLQALTKTRGTSAYHTKTAALAELTKTIESVRAKEVLVNPDQNYGVNLAIDAVLTALGLSKEANE